MSLSTQERAELELLRGVVARLSLQDSGVHFDENQQENVSRGVENVGVCGGVSSGPVVQQFARGNMQPLQQSQFQNQLPVQSVQQIDPSSLYSGVHSFGGPVHSGV